MRLHRLLSPTGLRAGWVLTGLAGAALVAAWAFRGAAATAPGPSVQQSEIDQAAERAGLCTAVNAKGIGLTGEYFAQSRLQGTASWTRTDGPVDVETARELSTSAGGPSAGSVRWRGWVKAPVSGDYRFHVSGAPSAEITVARQRFGAGGTSEGPIHLDAGRFYPIQVDVPDIPHDATLLRLEWTAPHGMRYVVPRAVLFTPTDTVKPPPRSA